MSFIGTESQGKVYAPGWFLAHEECERKTYEISASGANTAANGGKYVKMGTVYPSNDANAIGIVYEDVDVTSGAMPGSIVMKGVVYEDRLPVALDSNAKTALAGLGFTFIESSPSVTRPSWAPEVPTLKSITVTSEAGTAIGDTAITITGYIPASGEHYVYKVDTAAPFIAYGEVPDYSWTAWDGSSDITAQTGKKITIVSVNASNKAVASGNATVTAKS